MPIRENLCICRVVANLESWRLDEVGSVERHDAGSRNRETEKILHFCEDDEVAVVRFNLRLERRAQE